MLKRYSEKSVEPLVDGGGGVALTAKNNKPYYTHRATHPVIAESVVLHLSLKNVRLLGGVRKQLATTTQQHPHPVTRPQ